jgi:hypothetical protein
MLGGVQMTRATLLSALLAAATVALAPGSALASTDHLATIERECGVQLKLPPGACSCLRDHAGKLTDGQQAFLAAVVSKDKTGQKDIMQTLTVAELTEAGMFMTNAPAQCAKAGG